ncbi:hypothetical protein OOK58_42240 [Streptomyces sp. NBC_01728]|uniref:GIY-YIG nuclease family protein n=1 Tax=unclassified Streptomyces TaxID=2593676 RepID=UPI00225096F9|nr:MULTISPECIES: GIY-YIG nuclease family protein [unclassified Streptomyces]MCX4458536.1 hypothetical protein [Streptomyces sp. NBC_01719]MCX4497893.1 hypothetical protein [Streptomyces sp. NBC_01728]
MSRAWEAFKARVLELDGTVLEPEWLGSNQPHRIRCAKGHGGATRPSDVRKGRGICRTCSGRDPKATEAAFLARLAEEDAILLEPKWLGNKEPHRVRCAKGHECAPRPNAVLKGQGVCWHCSGRSPRVAEAAFLARLAEEDATLLEPKWLGSKEPHRVRCAKGHECTPRPNSVLKGNGICRTCAGRDPEATEAAFRARVIESGAVLLESVWLGGHTPHRVRCAKGHHVTPRPKSVLRGQGICRLCKGRTWDVLYVVQDEAGELLKIGITSGDPTDRIRRHRRSGLGQVVRLITGLPGGVARELERTILAALRDAGEEPVRGKEYFLGRTLALVLDLVDNHPSVACRSIDQISRDSEGETDMFGQ